MKFTKKEEVLIKKDGNISYVKYIDVEIDHIIDVNKMKNNELYHFFNLYTMGYPTNITKKQCLSVINNKFAEAIKAHNRNIKLKEIGL